MPSLVEIGHTGSLVGAFKEKMKGNCEEPLFNHAYQICDHFHDKHIPRLTLSGHINPDVCNIWL